MDKFRVMIADAEASVRQFIRYTLQDYFVNFEFEVATNGKNIMKRLESTQFDLILCDRSLPMLDAYELLKWIRNHKTLKNIAFIMITNDRNEEDLRKSLELGADACLLKPLLMEHLVSKVRESFDKLEKISPDRRIHERYKSHGTVLFSFTGQTSQGRILNVSIGGLLASFDRTSALPHIMDKVHMKLQPQKRESIEGFDGHVVRIQVVDSVVSEKQIYYAIKFVDEIKAETKKALIDLITSLKQSGMSYPLP